MREFRQWFNIGDFSGWICNGFGVDGTGVRPDLRSDLIEVVDVAHEIGMDSELREEGLHGIDGSAVQVGRRDDATTTFGGTQQRIRHRGHAGGDGHRAHTTFEFRQTTLEHIHSGIRHTRVREALGFAGTQRVTMRGADHVKRRTGVNRRVRRLTVSRPVIAAVNSRGNEIPRHELSPQCHAAVP